VSDAGSPSDLDPVSLHVVQILTQMFQLSEDDWRALTHHWTFHRGPDELFVDFLIRHDILTPAAPILLDLHLSGTVRESRADKLLHPDSKRNLDILLRRSMVSTQPRRDLAKTPPIPTAPSLIDAFPGTPELPQVGSFLGRCLLTDLIGTGGQGVIYRAFHRSLKIAVAVKLLLPRGRLPSDAERHQFASEVQLLAQLDHPNVVRVFDCDEEATPPYLVMEYVEGISFAELIQQTGRLLPRTVTQIGLHVGRALEALHRIGIVHRDVKPGNILLNREGTAKLTDLGLASPFKRPLARPGESSDPVVGTVLYLAPEQAIMGGVVDFRADLYSLGVTLYHALVGDVPFNAESTESLLRMHVESPPVPPCEHQPEIPRNLSDCIVRLLAKQPNDRFQSADELCRTLESVLSELP